MQTGWCQPGDVLLYCHAPNLSTRLIQAGERLEDGQQPYEFYHVALALGPYHKLEANGRNVAINPIDYGKFIAFRPNITERRRDNALERMHTLEGQPYDWVLIVDLALRYLTRGIIHLPARWVKSQERRKKICSSVVSKYFRYALWGDLKTWPPPSPEDIWLQVRDYEVKI